MIQGKTRYVLLVSLMVAFGALLVACSGPATVSAAPALAQTAQPTPTAVATSAVSPTAVTPAKVAATPEIPFFQLWAASAHNQADAPAFTHWDTSKDKTVEIGCAKCHSTTGFQDFVGADGSAAGKVDKAPAIGTTISCTACHNSATLSLTSVTFPSGAVVNGLGREAVCMTCHQGQASGATVDKQIKDAAVKDDDTVSDKIKFTNIHYFAAAVSRYGAMVAGGYQYPDKQYDVLFDHVSTVNTCQDCHNPHSLEVQVDKCGTCHTGVKTIDDVRKIRMASSLEDYNGNGNIKEPIRDEISGLRDMLYKAMQSYATDVAKVPLAYSADAYPYFFIDTNKNGKVDTDEAKVPNAYNGWTARLAKAAYNYQTSIKDPGAYAHGGKYIIELLYDSIEDLNTKLTTKVDLSKAHRIDFGHFAGSETAFRDWDADGAVPAGCAKCHSAAGLPQFINEGTVVSQHVSNGLTCETCHNDLTKFTLYEVSKVPFPSGASLSFGDKAPANLCIECHQGRESTVSVNKAVTGMDPDTISDKLSFKNVHYFAAGATLFGSDAKGVYEYAGQKYLGQFKHVANFDTCTGCHDTHTQEVKTAACKTCHQSEDTSTYRMPSSNADYDGDGNKTEGIKGEVDGMRDVLYTAIQAYAKDVVKKPIVYSAAAYPYFFNDTNADGKADEAEMKSDNKYASWTPRLLEAAYNLQYSIKDPGAFAHNGKYMIQVLYDSIKNLGEKVKVDQSKMTRP